MGLHPDSHLDREHVGLSSPYAQGQLLFPLLYFQLIGHKNIISDEIAKVKHPPSRQSTLRFARVYTRRGSGKMAQLLTCWSY